MFEGEGPRGLDALTRVGGGGREGWRPESVELVSGDRRTKALVSVIRRLASPAADQIAFLERLDVGVDELALQFTELTTSMPPGLTDACRRDLRSLDQLLAEISAPDRPALRMFEALESAPEWARVRTLAHEFLTDLSATPKSDRPSTDRR